MASKREEQNILKVFYEGMKILMEQKDETIDWFDTDLNVIPKSFENGAPKHSHSWYAAVATSEEIKEHQKMLDLGWSYDYPYYCLYHH